MQIHPRRNRLGSYLVMALPVIFILFSLIIFIVKLSSLAASVERLKKTSDATLASALSARAESLQTLAAAWAGVKPYLTSGTFEEAIISHASWGALKGKTADIKKSLPGYKGRIKSVLTVTGEANDIDRSRIIIVRSEALDLGVETMSQWVRDDQNRREKVPDLILHRLWSPGILNDQPIERAEIVMKGSVLQSGGIFVNSGETAVSIDRHSAGRLHWDVDPGDESLRLSGNGGYPRSWTEALNGTDVQPHRYPYYSFRMEAP